MFEHLSLILGFMCPDRTRKQLLREVVRGFIGWKKAVMKQIDDRQAAEVFFFPRHMIRNKMFVIRIKNLLILMTKSLESE